MELWQQLLFLCPMLFLAGVVDGISGGGGLIALPSYLMAGLPVTTAYACNKMQSCLGTCASLAKYAKTGFFDIKAAVPASLAAILGSWIATRIMFMLNDGVKLWIIAVLTVMVIILTLVTGWFKIDKNTELRISLSTKNMLTCGAIGFGLGLYDGFFGPGGGTVALLLFALFLKLDMRVGGGIGKMIVVTSNLTGMIAYISKGEVRYVIALPCAAVNIVGSYVGASLATKKGAGFVKYISWAVVAMLLIQTITKFMP